MVIQGMNSEGIHQKEDHSVPCMYIFFMVIVLIILALDIKFRLQGLWNKYSSK
jgi:hypothetical protein